MAGKTTTDLGWWQGSRYPLFSQFWDSSTCSEDLLMTLVACRHCPALVRQDRLAKHVQRVHAKSGELPQDKRTPTRKRPSPPDAAKREFPTVKCSYCGALQRWDCRTLRCARCDRVDNNPVLLGQVPKRTNSGRKKADTARRRKPKTPQLSSGGKKANTARRRKPKTLQLSYGPRYGYSLPCDPAKAQDDWWRLHGE